MGMWMFRELQLNHERFFLLFIVVWVPQSLGCPEYLVGPWRCVHVNKLIIVVLMRNVPKYPSFSHVMEDQDGECLSPLLYTKPHEGIVRLFRFYSSTTSSLHI